MTSIRNPVRFIWLLAALAASLSACGELPASLPEAIQLATPAPTATPTSTPVPTPTPTPTPMPIEVVHQGERDLRNGDWDAASLAFQQVLTDPGASSEERAIAEMGLAQASLRRGDFGSARAVLDSFLAEHPMHPRTAQAYFLRGDAKLGLSDWAGAIADFQTYLSLRPGPIDSYVYERIADAHLAAGEVPEALAAYDQALQAERHLVSELALRERIALVNRSLGNPGGAVAQYQAILEKAQSPPYLATIEFSLGQALFEAGELDAAYQRFEHVFMTYPDSAEALSALRALLDAQIPVDQFQRGVVNFNQGQYDIAIQAFLAHIAGLQDVREDTPLTHLYLARAYRNLGNIQAAQSELQALITRFNPEDGEAWSEAWLELADIYAALDDPENAFATYEEFLAEHGDLPQVAEALFRAGQLAASTGDHARAVDYFRRLAESFPDDPRAAGGLFEAGLAFHQAGDLATAETLFRDAAQQPANERPAASYLWLGKTLNAAGQGEEAAQALNSALAAEPNQYYGLRAADLLAGRPPFWPPEGIAWPEDPDEGRAEAEQWLVEQFALEATPPLAEALRGDIATDPRMMRARELWDLGQVVEARADFEAVRVAYQDDPLALYQMAIYFRELGLYRSSIQCVARLHFLADIAPLAGPVFLARLRYPTYFSDLVLKYSEQFDLDPLFVFSVIHQESLFEGFATSVAAAQGLMQIWPPTGEDIAAQIGWPNYHVSDLQRPFVNINFGTWLLRDEMNRFNGDPYAVLTAYNAGSGRALALQQASGGDPDLFLELIDLSEPKLYVQRISEHYAAYRALYGVP